MKSEHALIKNSFTDVFYKIFRKTRTADDCGNPLGVAI